jgi:hypothetical protein
VSLFGWLFGWTQFGDQNQVGETLSVRPERYQEKVAAFKTDRWRARWRGRELRRRRRCGRGE